MSIDLSFRGPTPDDLPYIMNSWLRGFRNSQLTQFISNESYYSFYKQVITSIIHASRIVLAVDPEDPNHIFGYLVYQIDGDQIILHWLNTKLLFRRFGVASALLKAAHPAYGTSETVCSHLPVSPIHRRAFRAHARKNKLHYHAGILASWVAQTHQSNQPRESETQ